MLRTAGAAAVLQDPVTRCGAAAHPLPCRHAGDPCRAHTETAGADRRQSAPHDCVHHFPHGQGEVVKLKERNVCCN